MKKIPLLLIPLFILASCDSDASTKNKGEAPTPINYTITKENYSSYLGVSFTATVSNEYNAVVTSKVPNHYSFSGASLTFEINYRIKVGNSYPQQYENKTYIAVVNLDNNGEGSAPYIPSEHKSSVDTLWNAPTKMIKDATGSFVLNNNYKQVLNLNDLEKHSDYRREYVSCNVYSTDRTIDFEINSLLNETKATDLIYEVESARVVFDMKVNNVNKHFDVTINNINYYGKGSAPYEYDDWSYIQDATVTYTKGYVYIF